MSFRHSITRLVRLLFLLALLSIPVLIYLCMKPPDALPAIPTNVDEQAGNFEKKIIFLEQSWSQKQSTEVSITSAELNAVYLKNRADDVRIVLSGNQAVVFLIKRILMAEVYIQVNGKTSVSHGHVLFSPTDVIVGTIHVPLSLANSMIQEKLHDPGIQELLHLPAYVTGVRIKDSQLIVSSSPKVH